MHYGMAVYLLVRLVVYQASCTRTLTATYFKRLKLVVRIASSWTMKIPDWPEEGFRCFCKLVMDASFLILTDEGICRR